MNAKARVESMLPTPFSMGGDRVVPAGVKVWPVKGKALGRLWSGAAVTTTRPFVASNFHGMPNNNKFSRFIELNKSGKQLYLITMFGTPKIDPADDKGNLIYGFIVDSNRTTPVSA